MLNNNMFKFIPPAPYKGMLAIVDHNEIPEVSFTEKGEEMSTKLELLDHYILDPGVSYNVSFSFGLNHASNVVKIVVPATGGGTIC